MHKWIHVNYDFKEHENEGENENDIENETKEEEKNGQRLRLQFLQLLMENNANPSAVEFRSWNIVKAFISLNINHKYKIDLFKVLLNQSKKYKYRLDLTIDRIKFNILTECVNNGEIKLFEYIINDDKELFNGNKLNLDNQERAIFGGVLFKACAILNNNNSNLTFIKLLLEYGANPNISYMAKIEQQ